MWGTLVGKGPVESSSKPLPDVHKDLDKCPHRLIHASYIKGGERRYSPIYLTSKSTNSFLPLVIHLLVIHLHSRYGFQYRKKPCCGSDRLVLFRDIRFSTLQYDRKQPYLQCPGTSLPCPISSQPSFYASTSDMWDKSSFQPWGTYNINMTLPVTAITFL